MSRRRVLIIEDMSSLQVVYRTVLNHEGCQVSVAGTAADGLVSFQDRRPSIVILDLLLPDRDGLELLKEMVAAADWDFRVIVVTAHGSVSRAVGAMRRGAFDFLVKPFDEARLVAAVRNAQSDLHNSVPARRAVQVNTGGLGDLVGSSPEMRLLFERINQVSRSMSTVFLTGETGTGKRHTARAIHRRSNRSAMPFVEVSCSVTAAKDLAEDLFGGCGAEGAFKRANGGTLYLTDVTMMPQNVQAGLLELLRTSSLPGRPAAQGKSPKVDVRLICGSCDDPMIAVENGTLREDLFYRLHVVPLTIPPLRERGDDAIQIAQWALPQLIEDGDRRFTGLSQDTKRAFAGHPWPGNVRQLLNLLRDTAVLQSGPLVELSSLPRTFLASLVTSSRSRPRSEPRERSAEGPTAFDHMAGNGQPGPDDLALTEAVAALAKTDMSLAEIERHLIEAVIAQKRGSVPKAARQLGLSPSTLYRKRDAWQRGAG